MFSLTFGKVYFMKPFLIIFLTLITFSVYSQDTPAYTRAKVITGDTGIVALQRLGIAVDDGYIKKGEYIIRDFSAAEMQKIQQHGFTYEVVISDVQQYYKDQNNPDKKKDDAASERTGSRGCGNPGYAVPQYFSLGSMGGFYTLDEINAQLDSVSIRFPLLASVKMPASGTITTYEGRTPYFIRISNNPGVMQNKPRILYSALTHAREPAGMQQLFYFVYYLLENYPQNKTVKYIIDNCELYILPCVNPDGYRYNQTTDPNGGGMHRKNMIPCDISNPGVDLNRNYGMYWGYDDIGSSPDPSTDVYRGTAGFSEAETQIMRDLYNFYQFNMSIDFHCYSNVLIYPWSYIDAVTPDDNLYQAYSELLTAANGYLYGNPMNTVGYTANGGSVDWFYGEQTSKPKVMCWSPEAGDMNDGFWPTTARIPVICSVNLEANILLALFSTYYSDVKDVSDVFSDASDHAVFDVKGLGQQLPADLTISIVPVYGIESVGSNIVLTGLQVMETRSDSISYQVTTGLAAGSQIKYMYNIQTPAGEYWSDTIVRIYGQPDIIFSDEFTNLSNWTTTTWGTTTSASCSGISSTTDTPTGNYNDNATRIITLSQPLNFSNSTFAALSFCAKWDICPSYDYVEAAASTDNGTTWNALCGRYTKMLAQNSNRFSYDGYQFSWVDEWIPLDDYLGSSVKIRFKLRGGYAVWEDNDGFYVDNLKVYANDTTTSAGSLTAEKTALLYPNPADDILHYSFNSYSDHKILFRIISVDGRCLRSGTSADGTINVSGLENGIYFIEIKNGDDNFRQKFVREKAR